MESIDNLIFFFNITQFHIPTLTMHKITIKPPSMKRKKEVVLPAFTVVERLTLTGTFPLTTVIPRIP